MKLHLAVRLGLVALPGVLLLGCAPTGTTVPETAPTGGPRAASESPTPKAPRPEPAQAIRPGPGEQTTTHAAVAHKSDAPAVAQAGGDPPRASENRESEWTMSVQPGGTVFILHNGVPVVKEQYITWAEKAQWVPTSFKTSSLSGGGVVLKGGIPKLDLEATGEIRPLADNQLAFEYRFNATKGHQGIRGAVLGWKFDLKSQTFSGKVAEPTLLENKTGWRWQVGPNQAITARFDQPLDLVIFERGNKDDIRTFYYADHFEPGSRQVSFTVELPEGGRIVPSTAERYGPLDTTGWYRDALSWDGSPVDLSFLNAAERPAGRHGLLKADGDQLAFEDGTSFRFWGCNVSAHSLFSTPRDNIPRQAHRLAQLGLTWCA